VAGQSLLAATAMRVMVLLLPGAVSALLFMRRRMTPSFLRAAARPRV
jgi:hypothetical protein